MAKLHWYIVAIPVMLSGIGLIGIGYVAKWTGFSEYTSPIHPEHTEFQRSKTLWDWLQLLIIPFVIAAGGLWFSAQQHQADLQIANDQHQTDLQIANDQQQETILKTYLDDMSDLLLTQKLSKSNPGDDVREVAKERTLIALRRLQGGRDKTVLQFLQEEHLVGIQNAVIDLKDADLSGDDLRSADLSGADLSGADLSGADLSGADLSGTFLSGTFLNRAFLNGARLDGARLDGATLSGAQLRKALLDNADLSDADLSNTILNGALLNGAYLDYADLSGAQLNDTDLSNAFLKYADLSGADLSHVGKFAPSQLTAVYSCTNTMLSTGLKCPHNRRVVTLTYWYTESPAETPVIRQLIQRFRHKYPNIRIKAVYKSFYVMQAAFMAATHGGNAPDVLRSDISWVPQLASQGYLLNIRSRVSDLSDYRPDPLRYDWYNGGLYGLPQVTDFLALLYNKTELEQVGIKSPAGLATMDDFKQAAKRIVQSKEAKYGFETAGSSYYVLPFLWAFGGGMLDQHNKPLVNSSGSADGLTFLLNLQNKDQVMPQVDLSNGYNNMVKDFKSGQTAMIFDGPYEVSNILTGSAFISNRDNLGIAAIPMGRSGNKPRSPLGGQSYVISDKTAHPDEAYEFISFMSSTLNQVAIAYANHTLPTRDSAYQDAGISSDPVIREFHSRSIQNTAIARQVIPQEVNLLNRLDLHIQNALDGTESPTDALKAVDADWSTLLDS